MDGAAQPGAKRIKRRNRDPLRPCKLTRYPERLSDRLDGSTLTVPKGELGDLRRQIAFDEHMGKGSRNTTAPYALSSAIVIRCICETSLGQRNDCRPAATERLSLPLRKCWAIFDDKMHLKDHMGNASSNTAGHHECTAAQW